MILRRMPLLATTASTLAALAIALPAVAPAATGSGATFGPDVVSTSLHLSMTSLPGSFTGTTTNLHWAGASRYRSVAVTPKTGDTIASTYTTDIVGAVQTFASGFPRHATGATRTTGANVIAPDGYDQLTADLLGWGMPLLERQRAGQSLLVPVTVGGRHLLRGRMRVTANECAGERSGIRTVDFDARTLVPVHVLEVRHGATSQDIHVQLGRSAAGAFRPLHLVGRVQQDDGGFIRSTPAQAAAALPFPVSMPAVLPEGYVFDHAGHAAQGATIGPEASFQHSKGLFAARFSRGFEPLELTIRKATGHLAADWDQSDPFGTECGFETSTDATVGAATKAHYALGDFGVARLWWRDGTTLYTLSGALSSAQLVAVANSLAPVTAAA